MAYHLDDTIAAIASAPGGAARGIVRLGGPDARYTVECLFKSGAGIDLGSVCRATAIPGELSCPDLNAPLPCDLYYWPDTRSYTRQPLAEMHTFGSPPLLDCVLQAACDAGARLAEPGEFTLRAFLAGRLDLTQAEAVLGVIDAGDRRQFDAALQQLAGGIAGPMTALRDRLLDLLAHLEAGLDFVEEDIEFVSAEQLEAELAAAAETVGQLAEQMASRGQSRDLIRAVLVGWPNVGKSSLFNALLGEQHALVSDTAGTTRDYLSAELDLAGIRVELIDTAGLEPDIGNATAESIAPAAQRLAEQQHTQADLRLLCLDSTRVLNAWERDRLAEADDADLIVLTKSDRPRHLDRELSDAVVTSTHSGAGLEDLRQKISAAVLPLCGDNSSVVAHTATRCRESLRRAAESLARARSLVQTHAGEELVAAETRVALDELGKVVGAVYSDDVLDRIFSRFCIGK